MPVTLHVRVWIEICLAFASASVSGVTLHVRVWIEIEWQQQHINITVGHPPREGVD